MASRRILAIFNPMSGRRRARLDATVAALREQGCVVTVAETQGPGHAETIAREAPAGDFDVIAAAGGDGTVNEVVNGLAGKSITLGIIPLGTANVLADEIGLKCTPAAIARALASGPVRTIHVGRSNGRRFCMMAGAGFDASVVAGISLALKKRLGALAYIWQAARQAFVETYAGAEVVIDGKSFRATSVVVCKGKRYGGPFIVAPNASLAAENFQVVLMKGRGWFSVARYGFALTLGRIAMCSDVEIVPGREVRIQGIVGAPVQADGDIIAHLPATISIDPEPIRLIYPR